MLEEATSGVICATGARNNPRAEDAVSPEWRRELYRRWPAAGSERRGNRRP